MNGNVSIFIEGIVHGEEESRITTKASGKYHVLDDVHILKYMESAVIRDENTDTIDKEFISNDVDCLNMIKISPGIVEMMKTGDNSTHMVFDLSKPTQSVYETPYGNLYFQIQTTRIDIEEKEKKLILNMEYSLSHEDSHISDNRIYLSADETI